MEKKIADKWIAALRSGKYTQGKKTLKTANGDMCCLGVLCDVYNPNGWSSKVEEFSPTSDTIVQFNCYVTGSGSEASSFLPGEVVAWADMKTSIGTIATDPSFREGVDLAELNDFRDYNFDKIADVIEKNWETL